MKLILVGEHVFRAVPNMVPVRKRKQDALTMEQQGWTHEGIAVCKIIMGDRENNPMLDILKPYLIGEHDAASE